MIAICIAAGAILATVLNSSGAYQLNNNPNRRAEILDTDGKYLLEWEVYANIKVVTFNVTVETVNWVGFGISNKGKTSAADVVIGGVRKDGSIYFSDRHVKPGNLLSELDRKQDWVLHSASENGTHTFLSFSRAYETCDSEDCELTLNKMVLLWAYGRDDDENGYAVREEGTYNVHLLDPDYAPKLVRDTPTGDPRIITANSNEQISSDTKVWSIFKSLTLSTNHTHYICSFHKAPRLTRKHHWIGLDITFGNEVSRTNTHHMLIYRCRAPAGSTERELFEPALSNPGELCYGHPLGSPSADFPTHFCTDLYFERSMGSKTFFMPNHVGFPFGEAEDEYYMIQLHYDNQERQSNVKIDLRVDSFYTSQLRPNEGGMLVLVSNVPGLPESVLIPPHSTSHRNFAHCGSECTNRMIPPQGIYISALTLHQHVAGNGARLRHFRGGKELPWILHDDNFDNYFQPFRHLQNEVRILPGDHLTYECRCSSNETTVVGGFTTRQAMCSTFIIYYNRIPNDYDWCVSEIHSEPDRERFFGIKNLTWVEDELEFIVNTPKSLAGLKLSEVSDHFVDWTAEKKQELRQFHETAQQTMRCVRDTRTLTLEQFLRTPRPSLGSPPMGSVSTPENYIGPVSYPFHATLYIPP